MNDPILAWHWLPVDRVPAHGRRRKPLKVGDVMRATGQPILCKRGLHASRRILDALQWAQGPIICRVRVSGTIIEVGDKLAGTRRHILAMADATTVLHEAACDWAEVALRRADVTDERSWAAIETKRRWIRGEATDEELGAARGDAWGAAARSAARSAAWDAARDTAGGSTWDAARVAAWSTAWGAAWDEMNADLERRVLALMEDQITRIAVCQCRSAAKGRACKMSCPGSEVEP